MVDINDVIFTSCAFGSQYIEQQKRLEASIREIYPEANMLFFCGRLPDESKPMHESLYGFKPMAISEASARRKKVVWLDPAMILTGPIDRLLKYSVVAVRDESKLSGCISDIFLNHIGYERNRLDDFKWHLVGGSLYYFDFDTLDAIRIFEMWLNFEQGGWFGSQKQQASEQINSHRNDESCMAIAMYLNGTEPVTPEEIGYCIEKEPMFRKLHFK